jgi:hypothetical protein
MWKDVLTNMILNKQYQQFQTLNKTEQDELLQFVRAQIIALIGNAGSNPSDVLEWAALVRAIEPMMKANNGHNEGAHAASTTPIRPFQNLSNTNFYQIREPADKITNISAKTIQFFLQEISAAMTEAEKDALDNNSEKPIDTIEVSFDDPFGTKGKLIEQLAWDIFNFDRNGSKGLLMIRQYYEQRILCFQGVDFIQRIEQTIVNELAMLQETEESAYESATKFQPNNHPIWSQTPPTSLINELHISNNNNHDDDDDYRPFTPPLNTVI